MDQAKRHAQMEWQAFIEKLQEADLPEGEKLLQAYDFIVDQHVVSSLREIELARALKDEETVIREQIKMDTLKYASKTLHDIHRIINRRVSK